MHLKRENREQTAAKHPVFGFAVLVLKFFSYGQYQTITPDKHQTNTGQQQQVHQTVTAAAIGSSGNQSVNPHSSQST
jgi:hypothetical protein